MFRDIDSSQNRHSDHWLDSTWFLITITFLNWPILLLSLSLLALSLCVSCKVLQRKGVMTFFCLGFRNMDTCALETQTFWFWLICYCISFFKVCNDGNIVWLASKKCVCLVSLPFRVFTTFGLWVPPRHLTPLCHIHFCVLDSTLWHQFVNIIWTEEQEQMHADTPDRVN